MESDLQHQQQYHHHHLFNDQYQQQQQQQKHMSSSSLTRYQSAPSSLFSNLLECEEFFNRPTSPETERIFARFLANSCDNSSMPNQNFSAAAVIKQDSSVRDEGIAQQTQILGSINNETILNQQQQQSNYAPVSQGFFQTQSKPPLPDQSSVYRTENSMARAAGIPPMKSGGSTSNLVRHSSSPAGLFANITFEMENGYAVMRELGDYSRVKRETSYFSSSSAVAVSRPPTVSASAGRMSPIAEIGNINNMGETANSESGVFVESRNSDYVTGYPIGNWDENTAAASSNDRTLSGINASEAQRESGIPAPPMLAHHLSLPKTAAEMSAIEKFLHLHDSVPCKIRAKRGFATHPRSIAERVRRTKISERMRKLQDLVPNMDKQTNTSDMLDLAVDYIKDLQRQVKTLSESRAKCTCDIKQQL